MRSLDKFTSSPSYPLKPNSETYPPWVKGSVASTNHDLLQLPLEAPNSWRIIATIYPHRAPKTLCFLVPKLHIECSGFSISLLYRSTLHLSNPATSNSCNSCLHLAASIVAGRTRTIGVHHLSHCRTTASPSLDTRPHCPPSICI